MAEPARASHAAREAAHDQPSAQSTGSDAGHDGRAGQAPGAGRQLCCPEPVPGHRRPPGPHSSAGAAGQRPSEGAHDPSAHRTGRPSGHVGADGHSARLWRHSPDGQRTSERGHAPAVALKQAAAEGAHSPLAHSTRPAGQVRPVGQSEREARHEPSWQRAGAAPWHAYWSGHSVGDARHEPSGHATRPAPHDTGVGQSAAEAAQRLAAPGPQRTGAEAGHAAAEVALRKAPT